MAESIDISEFSRASLTAVLAAIQQAEDELGRNLPVARRSDRYCLGQYGVGSARVARLQSECKSWRRVPTSGRSHAIRIYWPGAVIRRALEIMTGVGVVRVHAVSRTYRVMRDEVGLHLDRRFTGRDGYDEPDWHREWTYPADAACGMSALEIATRHAFGCLLPFDGESR